MKSTAYGLKSTEITPAEQVAAPTLATSTLQQQLDQAIATAQQNVTAFDADAANRTQHLQAASQWYRQALASDDIYEWQDTKTTFASTYPNADELVFTVSMVDANTPPAPPGAQALLDLSAPAPPMAMVPAPTLKGTTPPATSKKPVKVQTGPAMSPSDLFRVTQPSKGQSGPDPKPSGSIPIQPGQEMYVYVTGKLKVDFSTGLFASNLTDRNYNAVGSGTSFKIVEGSHNDFVPSIGGLAHVYITSLADFVPALSFGVGLPQNGNPQYFLGGSLIMGNDARFILTAGLALGQVQRLDGLSIGSTIGSSIVPVRNVFRTGLFLGLTYNLAPKN